MSTDQNKQLNNCVEKCYSCGGKGTYSQMHGVHGAEDFGGDGFDEKPSIHNYPCKACNGTGFKPKSNYEGEEKKEGTLEVCYHKNAINNKARCPDCGSSFVSLPPQENDWKEKFYTEFKSLLYEYPNTYEQILSFIKSLLALREQEAYERGQQEERKFILNILDGIDRADKEMGNKYGGTNAIRFALQSRFIGKMSLSPEEEK